MYTYSVSNIEDKRNTYGPGQTVSITFPPGAYILDTNEIYLLFDSVFSGTGAETKAMYPRQPEDFF